MRAAMVNLALAVLGVGATGCARSVATPPAAASPGAPAPAASPRIEWVTLGPREGVALDARYPHVVLADARAAAAVNNALDLAVLSMEDELVLAARNARQRPDETNLVSWRLETRCTPTLVTDEVVSVRCLRSDHRGGAHPAERATALNLALSPGAAKPFDIDHMFLPGKDHRRAISALAVAALRRQNAQWMREGLDDVTALLHTVNVTPAGLLITFDPYETGPSAQGFMEVEIAWDDVRALVDPKGPVGATARPS